MTSTQAIRDRIERLKKLRAEATQGEWRWQDAYGFREHLEHQQQGLDADCSNIEAGRIRLEPSVLSDWADHAGDSGLTISIADARFIAASANEWNRILQDLETACTVLEFYGEGNNWAADNPSNDTAADDCGNRAREALATIARVDGGAG